ncbi:recombinase family protein [Salibacterium qingdaonense]|uniref:Site-specific DNA recombinase n=1 Tax=Salibacterium qingdaonense TaxID=266892 RepID=A0A1I4NJB6_9BACI|nr:recombinase family protein [Salibacterium qingdaonense]SFM15614.1 Site-specific DNA recombinase [Salibacterium qingdaonense]
MTNSLNQNKRMIIFARRSLEEQNNEGLSYQIKMCERFAEEQGFDVVEVIKEEASAYNVSIENRSQLQKLLNRMMDEDVDGVVCWQKSRIVRSVEDAVLINGLMDKADCELLFADPTEPPMGNDEMEKLYTLISSWRDEAEVSKLRNRIKDHLRQRAKSGNYVGGSYTGYQWNTMTKKLEQIPGQIDAVKNMFHYYLYEGCSAEQIAHLLNQQGYKTKWGKQFYPSTVINILQNKIYCGYYRWGFQTSQRRGPAEEAEGYDQKVSWVVPIIDLEEWSKVQEIMVSRSGVKRGQKRQPKPSSTFLLSGKVYCGVCGTKMMAHNGTNQYTRKDGSKRKSEYLKYSCYSRAEHGVQKRVDAMKLDQEVLQCVTKELASMDENELLETSQLQINEKTNGLYSEQEAYKKRVEQCYGAIHNLLHNVEQTTDPEMVQMYEARIKEQRQEAADYEKREREVKQRLQQMAVTQNDIYHFYHLITQLKNYEVMSQEKKKLYIEELVEQVTVSGKDIHVSVKYNIREPNQFEKITHFNIDIPFRLSKK